MDHGKAQTGTGVPKASSRATKDVSSQTTDRSGFQGLFYFFLLVQRGSRGYQHFEKGEEQA